MSSGRHWATPNIEHCGDAYDKDAYNKIWEIRTKNLKNIYDDLIMALHDEKHANMTCDAIAKLDEAM